MEQSHFTQNDRDLIKNLEWSYNQMSKDLNRLSISVAGSDHEARIRLLEKSVEDFALVKKVVYGMVALILLAFFGVVIRTYIK